MKKLIITGLLTLFALPAFAQEKLRIIDLGEPEPAATQAISEPAPSASPPTAGQARMAPFPGPFQRCPDLCPAGGRAADCGHGALGRYSGDSGRRGDQCR